MRDRIAIHKLVDRVLDELDEGKNFVDLGICTWSIELRAQAGVFDSRSPYAVNVEYNDGSSFTMDDAELLIKKLDALADTNQND